MKKEFITEAKRLQELAGILTEYQSTENYYALFNLLGDYNNGVPLYIITDTKEKMVDKLNKIYLELTGEKQAPYSIEDMEDQIYMGKKLDHYISDDWASVTNNEQVFKNDIKHLKKTPTKIN